MPAVLVYGRQFCGRLARRIFLFFLRDGPNEACGRARLRGASMSYSNPGHLADRYDRRTSEDKDKLVRAGDLVPLDRDEPEPEQERPYFDERDHMSGLQKLRTWH